jgi:hypothetical protein
MSENLLKLFPKKRVQPYDGMAITAQVWEAAHTTHARMQQSHNLFFHGAGILTGLEVIASDPPDRIVYILPGVAVDPYGQVIVLSDPVAYDLGEEVEGMLYLLLSRRESKLSSGQESSGEAAYVQDEFLITARSSFPESPVIELARFQRQTRTSALNDAADPQRPLPNQIDLRYRAGLQTVAERLLSAAVIYLGKGKEHPYGLGLSRLSNELRHMPFAAQPGSPASTLVHLIVEDNLQLDPGVLGYNLICLVGRDKFQISASQLKGLQGYLERGGTVLLEALDDTSKSAFVDLAFQLGLKLGSPSAGHPLLENPFLFAAPPAGYEARAEVLTGDANDQPGGFILSTANYGGLWSGKGRERAPSREEIRSAFEWGANLMAYVAYRHEQASEG